MEGAFSLAPIDRKAYSPMFSYNAKADQIGNSFPWRPLSTSTSNSFGKKRKRRKKKKTGWCITKTKRIVKAYTSSGKLKKSCRFRKIYRKRKTASNALKRKKKKTRKSSKKRTKTGWAVTKKFSVVKAYTKSGKRKKNCYAKVYKTKKSATTAKNRLKKKKGKSKIGYIIRGSRIVPVYKLGGGKVVLFNNRRKPVGMRVHNTLTQARSKLRSLKALAKRFRWYPEEFTAAEARALKKQVGIPGIASASSSKRRSSVRKSKPRRNSVAFGAVNPSNRYNYKIQQYATNVGTPTLRNMKNAAHTGAYSYPLNAKMLSNYTYYRS